MVQSNGLSDKLLTEIKPFLSGLDLADINCITEALAKYNWEDYTEYMLQRNSKFKNFYTITADIIKPYLCGSEQTLQPDFTTALFNELSKPMYCDLELIAALDLIKSKDESADVYDQATFLSDVLNGNCDFKVTQSADGWHCVTGHFTDIQIKISDMSERTCYMYCNGRDYTARFEVYNNLVSVLLDQDVICILPINE